MRTRPRPNIRIVRRTSRSLRSPGPRPSDMETDNSVTGTGKARATSGNARAISAKKEGRGQGLVEPCHHGQRRPPHSAGVEPGSGRGPAGNRQAGLALVTRVGWAGPEPAGRAPSAAASSRTTVAHDRPGDWNGFPNAACGPNPALGRSRTHHPPHGAHDGQHQSAEDVARDGSEQGRNRDAKKQPSASA
jgi:hypothetical protein